MYIIRHERPVWQFCFVTSQEPIIMPPAKEKRHQSSPLSQDLMLSATAQTQAMVQIPADTLSGLIFRINSLRNDVSTLQSKLSSLDQSHREVSTKLLSLQKENGPLLAPFPRLPIKLQKGNRQLFAPFPRLPIELRMMIWKFALTSIPQTHILGKMPWGTGICTRSKVNSVFLSCKEAWKTAESSKLDYIIHDAYLERSWLDSYFNTPHEDLPSPAQPKNYVNFDIDTFWLTSDDYTTCIPRSVTACCGACKRQYGCSNTTAKKCARCFEIPGSNSFPINTLVIRLSAWQPPESVRFGAHTGWPREIVNNGTLGLLRECQVRELLIVNLCSTIAGPTSSTKFVDALATDAGIFSMQLLDVARDRSHSKSWSSLADDIVEFMEKFKTQRAIDRATCFQSVYSIAPDLFTFDLIDSSEFQVTEEQVKRGEVSKSVLSAARQLGDFSGWKVPSVRFVDAVPNTPYST